MAAQTPPSTEHIVGRQAEKAVLAKVWRSAEPELLALYGRRRVGKTFLIREYFGGADLYFELTGLQHGTLVEQLKNFAEAFGKLFLDGHPLAPSQNWTDAFRQLTTAIDRHHGAKRVVLFFDEVPWLAARRSNFLQALEYLWNTWASKKRNVTVILCGSATSWMIEKIVHNKGGLHNRITRRIRLLPFTLAETEQYLQSRGIHLERRQVLELYMAIGGVPHYLKAVETGRSAAQNVNRICFTKDGILSDEFGKLYSSLFEHSDGHIDVVTALATKRSGLSRNALLAALGLESGGGVTKVLTALEESGFIASAVPFGKSANEATYRLIDEYSLFYLTWIHKAPKVTFASSDHDYWLHKQNSRSWQAWAGCSFEGVCLKHSGQLKKALGIGGMSSLESSWIYRAKNKKERGVQIDLLFDRADQCITLCEIKYANTEFVMTKKHAAELKAKRDTFVAQTATKKNIFIVLITTYGAQENRHYEGLVSQQLTMDDLFGA